MPGQTLEQKISAVKELGFPFPEVPNIIKNNLNPLFQLRPYQIEAFSRFIFYMNNPQIKQKPTQLLFHMATGSGKTLIMAGVILYLYEKGYRNFIFFVNSTNIINKTRDNFLNPLSIKYLFSENITYGDKQIRIKEVDNFQIANQEDINIVFSTIQGLHSRLNTPRENSITYDDFSDKKIVLLSDEAHHINVETRKGKLTIEEKEEIISWEGTVNRIFKSNPDNILLEFTATIDFSNQDIANKYFDKHIFDYPLKQFRLDGYSKEVKVLEADLQPIDRALQGILLNQYRRKIFEKYKKRIKPVILFKSKTIAESENLYEEFKDKIKNLKEQDIQKLNSSNNDKVIKRIFEYFEKDNISIENVRVTTGAASTDVNLYVANVTDVFSYHNLCGSNEAEQNYPAYYNTITDLYEDFNTYYGTGSATYNAVTNQHAGVGAENLSELSDVTSATQTDKFVITSDGAEYFGKRLVAADIDFSTDLPITDGGTGASTALTGLNALLAGATLVGGVGSIIQANDGDNDSLHLKSKGTGTTQINYNGGTGGLQVFDGSTNYLLIMSAPGDFSTYDGAGNLVFQLNHNLRIYFGPVASAHYLYLVGDDIYWFNGTSGAKLN